MTCTVNFRFVVCTSTRMLQMRMRVHGIGHQSSAKVKNYLRRDMAPPYSTDLRLCWRIIWAVLTLHIFPDECRARYMAEISIYDPSVFVLIDETGCDRCNSRRSYGYSVRGIPPCDHRLLICGVWYSGITVMSMEGIHDVQLVEGSVNGDKFGEFVTNPDTNSQPI